MTIDLYLDYLEPPGALACAQKLREPWAELDSVHQVMSIFIGKAMHVAMLHLQTQIIEAGKMASGTKPPGEYLHRWQKTAQPIGFVMLSDQLCLIGHTPTLAEKHPLVPQAWRYLKAALDLVTDDFRGDAPFATPEAYGKALPLAVKRTLDALPRLEFAKPVIP